MIKKITYALVFVALASCQSNIQGQDEKTKKAASASERINASEHNSKTIRNQLDE